MRSNRGALFAVAISIVNSASAGPTLDDIVNRLPVGSSLPESIYSHYSVNEIAESLVRMKSVREGRGAVAALNEFSIALIFHERDLEDIGSHGFRNLFQTGKSSGSTDFKAREIAEDEGIGLKLGMSSAGVAVRPKYALANPNFTERTSDGLEGAFGPALRQYGSVVAVLKDDVKRRATWTNGDTLAATSGGRPHSWNPFTVSASATANAVDFYYEAQVLGSVTLDDVDHFIVLDDGKYFAKNDNFIFRLQRYLRPIYLGHYGGGQDMSIVEKGENLFGKFRRDPRKTFDIGYARDQSHFGEIHTFDQIVFDGRIYSVKEKEHKYFGRVRRASGGALVEIGTLYSFVYTLTGEDGDVVYLYVADTSSEFFTRVFERFFGTSSHSVWSKNLIDGLDDEVGETLPPVSEEFKNDFFNFSKIRNCVSAMLRRF